MTQLLTAPGELHTATIGRITLTAQLCVDGGVTITVWTGPDRRNATTWTYSDRQHARTRYAQIRHLADTGLTAQQIADSIGADREHAVSAVRGILDEALQTATADDSNRSGGLVAALQQTVAGLETPAETADLAVLAVDVAETMREAQQPVADEATAYLAGLAAQRQARIEQAVAAADSQPAPTTLDAYVHDRKRANGPRLRHNTPSARKLSARMSRMLADLHRAADDDRALTVTTAAEQTTARALKRRGLVATERVAAGSLHVWLTPTGRSTAAQHASTSTEGVAA